MLSIVTLGCRELVVSEAGSESDVDRVALVVPDRMVDKTALWYNRKTSLWTIDEQLFSGYAVGYFEDGQIMEKIGILNGRKQNQSVRWFSNGYVRQVENYHKGKLHGEKKIWSSGSAYVLLAHLNYKLGRAHGEQRKWYGTGEIYKKLHLQMGREEGIQQAFRKNGDLYANYEARNGRIFGLKKASLCFDLEDESIQ